jgi:lactoylglutathione lyase
VTTTPSVNFMSATPNLLVSDMAASLAFYRDVLGFQLQQTVPDESPFVFAWLKRGGVEIFLNDAKPVVSAFSNLRAGNTSTLFVIVDDVDGLHGQLKDSARIVMGLTNQFYGMREFALLDPDGYLITFAQRIAPQE